ncbi:glycosyl hydrolase 108 family protein [Methylibium sp.]|uniref:glycoside hydrolase family 108 protein n=1 Tax=Methylibium sp. TaxID=2067992 RepID=UPI001848C3B8|nr:glycosyl hydrolase 108 family protein [Methylibium sp.]MBA3588217.1 glycoside hydrolase family 108 protein [Methylibium sp.]
MEFDAAFDRLLGHEGGYSFHADDPGRETMWGVTARVARSHGYTGDMSRLPRETAKAIYRASYWDAIRADELPEALRYTVFDAAVNSGVRQAIRWLQRAVDVGDDGVIGSMTMAAARRADGLRTAVEFNGHRLDLMTSLPTWNAFGKGWSRRIADELLRLARA